MQLLIDSGQGVKTQRRNLQHGEEETRLVFGLMISLRRAQCGGDGDSTAGLILAAGTSG